MSRFYDKGMRAALTHMGLKVAAEYEEEEQGAPFPEKSDTINAERLAKMLRDADDEEKRNKEPIAPENPTYNWNRPVTWDASTDLSGYDASESVAGLMLPSSPRA